MRLESLVRMAVAEEEFELRLETFAERGRRLDLPDDRRRPAAASWRSASPRRSSWPCPTRWPASGPRWSAPSPPTRPSTICTSGPSTPWCCGPATTRPRRCRSPPACGATPASTTCPPCSICSADSLHRRRRGLSTAASPTWPRRRRRTIETAKRVIELARSLSPPERHPPGAGKGAQLRPDGRRHRPLHPRPVRRPPGPPGPGRAAAQPAAVASACCGSPTGRSWPSPAPAAGSTAPCRRSAR